MSLFLDFKKQSSNEKLKKIFQKFLKEESTSKVAIEYLKNRKINEESIKVYEIGWCPPSLKQKLPEEKKFLSGGVIFPIVNEYGNTIAFSRRLPQLEEINPEVKKWFNESYVKTHYLYGLNVALPYIIKYNFVIIVEGQCDVVMCNQGGLKNTIGTMGTTLTKEHIIKLSRITTNFIFMFDGDNAGRMASQRGQELVKSLDEKFKYLDVFLFAKGKDYDPDLFIREFGSEKLINHIKKIKSNIL